MTLIKRGCESAGTLTKLERIYDSRAIVINDADVVTSEAYSCGFAFKNRSGIGDVSFAVQGDVVACADGAVHTV